MKWIPVSEELPPNPMRVLFTWSNELGKSRTALGFYARKCEIEGDDLWEDDDELEHCEQDEDGIWWLSEGWYEDAYSCETLGRYCNVTHWMLIPPRPPC